MQHCDAFDYWGRGTEVTVSTVNAASPTLFPLVQCTPGSADKVTVGCLAKDYYPKSLTFQWTDGSGNTMTSVQHPPVEKNNKYTGVSLLQVEKSDWDSKRSFNCSVTHSGEDKRVTLEKAPPPKVTLLAVPGGDDQALVCTIQDFISNELSVKWEKDANDVTGFTTWDPKKTGSLYSAVSVLKVRNTDWDSGAVYTCEVMHQGTKHTKKVTKAPTTMTLRHSSPKDVFINNQAKLKCVVTGQDINQIKITWEIDGRDVTGNNTETTTSEGKKTSTITRSRTDWRGVNTVRCLALRDDMTPVIQDLTLNKGDGSEPTVTVHVLPEEDISSNSAKVTLVCLVFSGLKTDYYIAWSEHIGQNAGSYTDGIDSLPQENKDGYSVTSVYTTTKDKWDKHTMFSCNAWPASSNNSKRSRNVSKALNNSTLYLTQLESKLRFALSCTDEAIEEEEYSSLWFTTSSFIFLFISSLLYSMIFSLVKMKKP